MKNILIVSHCDFPDNSAVQIHHLANGLVNLGCDCIVAVPNDKYTVSTVGQNLYKVTEYSEIATLNNLFDNQQKPDIVHAWTPRERVRIYCYKLVVFYEFKQVIQLEDSEECILERFLNQSMPALLEASDDLIPPNLSHPRKYREFLATADGVTVIMDRLQEFVPESVPVITLWPGVDTHQFFPRAAKPGLGQALGIPPHTTVLCYTGNVHPANADEMRCLYLAVGLRNRAGQPTVLVRTGSNDCRFLGDDEDWAKQYAIELGRVDREKIPDILALADVLVQPGQSDAFNDYRFPSKLPEFLAMGKPVILPATNIGRFMKHGQDAFILPVVDEVSLPGAIDLIVHDRDLTQKLSKGAVNFAHSHLDWAKSSQHLLAFYDTLLDERKQPVSRQNALKRVQIHAQAIQTQLEQTQAAMAAMRLQQDEVSIELARSRAQLQLTQAELASTHNQLQQAQTELASTHNQLQQTQAELASTHNQLQQTEAELEQTRARNSAIESSKFWKLRIAWFRLRHLLGWREKS